MSTRSNTATKIASSEQQAPVLEMVLFRLQPGVSQETMLVLADEMQNWLNEQPGYLSRELFMGEDGQWLDTVHWASMSEALAASERIFAQPFAANFGNIFAPDANGQHLYRVRNYASASVS